jgi:hypothetical protein
MNGRGWRWVAVGAVGLVLLSAGVAAAVSGGGYDPEQQDCSANAEAYSTSNSTEPGCHNFKLNVDGSDDHRYAEFGIDQQAEDQNAHSGMAEANAGDAGPGVATTFDTNYQPIPPGGPSEFGLFFYPADVAECLAAGGAPDTCVFRPNLPDPETPPTVTPAITPTIGTVDPDGSVAALVTGFSIYLGADDNLNTGEHDGADGLERTHTDRSVNGPSDGGALVFNWHPLEAGDWLTLFQAVLGDPEARGELLSNPVPVADAGLGMCTDGLCASAQTRKRVVYQGGTEGERDATDYEGKEWDPAECSSASLREEEACIDADHPEGMNAYHDDEKTVVAQPGVQAYEDPDPSGSPLGDPYPIPAAYAGTCGVTAGGGPGAQVPDSPVTNEAGQARLSTGC